MCSSLIGLLSMGVSSTVMAMEMNISNGKLLSHTETASGKNTSGFVTQVNNDKIKNLNLKAKNKIFPLDNNVTGESIFAVPVIEKATGSINTPIAIIGRSEFSINNRTASTHTYDIETTICVDNEMTNFSDCFVSKDKITLNPEGSASYAQVPTFTLNEIFNSAGSQNTAILTSIRSDSGETLFTTAAFSSVEVK